LQPENPAEFGGRVYEMMAMALAGNRDSVISNKDDSAVDAVEEDSSGESEAEVVEASEVRTECDPWKQ
jgi:heat shock protein beta